MRFEADSRLIQKALMAWYEASCRELPWRRTRDPYKIWVAEIMLQQTQVATVIPYYERFLQTFPTLRALAEAPLERVLKVWEGLGYYSRARHLHEASRILAKGSGRLPEDVDQLRVLPGIGRYTAGAIASIAFGRDEPVLDGNVTRVLCRVFLVRSLSKSPATQKKLWLLARGLIPPGHAGQFNQALMELGAMVCLPRNPQCLLCPLSRLCLAREHGEEGRLPIRKPRPPRPHRLVAVAVIRRGKRVLISKRPPQGLLAGLWEFPGGKIEEGETPEEAVRREVKEELGIVIRVQKPLTIVKHEYTHFKVTLHVFNCTHVSGRPRPIGCEECRWVAWEDLDHYPFPKANKKILFDLSL